MELELENKKEAEATKDSLYWSLHSNEKFLPPLVFSNGKSQEDVVKEVIQGIKSGRKLIFLRGMCGTGKSAIALNVARILGKSSIVVPVKALQKQYEDDYTSSKYVLKKDGVKMKIATITGRENHDSIIKSGSSCADPILPENIKITDKNYEYLKRYYLENPLIINKINPQVRLLKRLSIAPANPYWSPIIPANFELTQLRDAKKMRYKGLSSKEFIFYHRKKGCSYYDQYLAYLEADVIIFNSAKYKIEVALDRKPETEVDIIDEADEFLDSFCTQEEINLTILAKSLNTIIPNDINAKEIILEILELLKSEEKNKQALGVNEQHIFHVSETKIEKILKLILKNPEIEAEIILDTENYANKALESAKIFKEILEDTYLTFRRDNEDLIVQLVSANLSKRFQDIIDKNKSLVLMSGTFPNEKILNKIFGINEVYFIDAEVSLQGTVEIQLTGKEFACPRSHFINNKNARKEYLFSLSKCVESAGKPTLVHVNAYEDLPTEKEALDYNILNILQKENFLDIQKKDKDGSRISLFKSKFIDILFTTKCTRGVDFPGDMCNSIIFTKYPNPNLGGIFWKILRKTHPENFWEFYQDKARREFLQRIFRAVRSKEDFVSILSPDKRVLDAVKILQVSILNNFNLSLKKQ